MSRMFCRAATAVIGFVLVLGTASAAGATSDLQSRIDAGSAYATGRGTTIRIAVLDRVTGESTGTTVEWRTSTSSRPR